MKEISFIFILTLLCFAPIEGRAQKEYREVKALLKNNDAKGALKEVERLGKMELYREDPKRLEYAIEAYLKLLDAENEKNYLKQKYDTLGNYNYSYQLCQQILQHSTLEGAKHNKKMRLRYQNYLSYYYPNIKSAANYFFQKKNYQEALRYLDFMINLPQQDMAHDVLSLTEKEKSRAAYLCLLSMSALGNAGGVLAYADEAVKDSLGKRNVLEIKSLALYEQGDVDAYVRTLNDGLNAFAKYPFFYDRLSDYYLENKKFSEAITLADKMLASDNAEIAAYWMTKSTALMNLKRYEEAITAGKRAIQLDGVTTNMMNFVVGASYCNMALAIELPVSIHSVAYNKAINQQKELYSLARPYLEAYRQAAPEAEGSWAPLLYRVYLTLNLGKQFEEIEKYVR